MKVCIYGAGAIGGWIGAGLAQAGSRLNVVARGATLEALQRDGLSVMRGEQRTRVPVNAVADPAALGVQDLVVVAVKAPALQAVAAQIAPLLGPETIVLTAMNGVPWWFLQGGFGGSLAGTQLQAVDPGGSDRRGDSRAARDRLRGACQLFARCAGRGAAPLRQRADHRRALGRGDAACDAARSDAEAGGLRGRACRRRSRRTSGTSSGAT